VSDHCVTIQNLHFAHRNREIFKGIDIVIPYGKIVAIMGPSGSGKTTLLKLIGGQLDPTRGSVHVNGDDIHQLSRRALYKVRRKMGMLFQSGALFTNLNVFENVAYPLREHTSLNEDMIRDIVLMKLEAVGLRGARHLMPSELSGGMTRRVALSRALALDPKLMMYDEPFTGQDPISMGVLMKLIKSLNEILGITSIIVSHDVYETASIADYIYVIAEGKVIGHGTPEEMKETSQENVKQFLKGLPDGPVPFHYATVDWKEDLLATEEE
jgi:phospholipid/cholesterol/gamma-HCH transport system ATP-binding protein